MIRRFLFLVATDQITGFAVSIVKAILRLFSWAYRFFVTLRRAFYKIGLLQNVRLSIPVISIGNLTVGGTGKTPLTEYIARALIMKGIKPAILTRGYMWGRANGNQQASDEAKMLANALSNVPILAGANRVKSAKNYLEHSTVDVFLLDDGFQRYQLFRDLDIVTIDTTNPWGNGCLLPRGILREPRNALKRAQLFVLTKADLGKEQLEKIAEDLKTVNPEAMLVEAIHKPVSLINQRSGEIVDLRSIKGRKICAFSSIGAPRAFTRILEKCNAGVRKHFEFMDHYCYQREDIECIVNFCQDQEIKIVVTTEKDSGKLSEFLDIFPDQIQIWSLKIKIAITNGEEQFLERIHHIL